MTVIEVAFLYDELLKKIHQRFETGFIPFTALNHLRTTNCLTEVQAVAVAKNFFHNIKKYMEDWQKKLINIKSQEIFFLNRTITHAELASAACELLSLSDDEMAKEENNSFEVCVALNEFITKNLGEEDWRRKKLIEKWTSAFEYLVVLGLLDLNLLKKMVEFILVMPGTNADCERLFSLINIYWSDEKSHLEVVTLEAVMKVKNLNVSCEDFFNLIKDNETLLREFLKSDKYVK
jgi:hypothetical protein